MHVCKESLVCLERSNEQSRKFERRNTKEWEMKNCKNEHELGKTEPYFEEEQKLHAGV